MMCLQRVLFEGVVGWYSFSDRYTERALTLGI